MVQGCVITRYRDGFDLLELGKLSPYPNWFLVQTNYDHWTSPPVYDDRRTPAVRCLSAAPNDSITDWRYGQERSSQQEHYQLRTSPGDFFTNDDIIVSIPRKFNIHFRNKVAYKIKKLKDKEMYNRENSISMQLASATDGYSDNIIIQQYEGASRQYGSAPVDKNASWSLMYNMLSSRPVLNKLTTYTTLMSPGDGSIGTWLRNCPDPCWPW